MPLVSDTLAAEQREAGRREREALGHYLGGTLYYAGEWYWGIDRLPYLEERLIQPACNAAGTAKWCISNPPCLHVKARTTTTDAGVLSIHTQPLQLYFHARNA